MAYNLNRKGGLKVAGENTTITISVPKSLRRKLSVVSFGEHGDIPISTFIRTVLEQYVRQNYDKATDTARQRMENLRS